MFLKVQRTHKDGAAVVFLNRSHVYYDMSTTIFNLYIIEVIPVFENNES